MSGCTCVDSVGDCGGIRQLTIGEVVIMAPLCELSDWGIDAKISKRYFGLVAREIVACDPFQPCREPENCGAVGKTRCFGLWRHRQKRRGESTDCPWAGVPIPHFGAWGWNEMLGGKAHARNP